MQCDGPIERYRGKTLVFVMPPPSAGTNARDSFRLIGSRSGAIMREHGLLDWRSK